MENVVNTLHLSGKVIGTPVVGHEAFGEKFYYLTLGVPRLSGAQDQLPVTLSERLLDGAMLSDGDALSIEGNDNVVRGCRVLNVLGNAICMKGYRNLVTECDVSHTGKGGIVIDGGETETLLFCLQTALGAVVIGFGFGYLVARKKYRTGEAT